MREKSKKENSYSGLKKKTALLHVKLETFPSRLHHRSVTNNVNYLKGKDEHSTIKQSSSNLHYNGQKSFYFSLVKMSEYHNFCNFNYNTLNESKIKKYIYLIIMQKKEIYLFQFCNQTLQHSQKQKFLLHNQKDLCPLCLPRSNKKKCFLGKR